MLRCISFPKLTTFVNDYNQSYYRPKCFEFVCNSVHMAGTPFHHMTAPSLAEVGNPPYGLAVTQERSCSNRMFKWKEI